MVFSPRGPSVNMYFTFTYLSLCYLFVLHIKTFLLIYQNLLLYQKVQTPCLLPQTLEMINYASQAHRLSSVVISKVGEIIINKRINIIGYTLS